MLYPKPIIIRDRRDVMSDNPRTLKNWWCQRRLTLHKFAIFFIRQKRRCLIKEIKWWENWCLNDNWPKSGYVKVSKSSLWLWFQPWRLETNKMIETVLVLSTFFGHVLAGEFQWVSKVWWLKSTFDSSVAAPESTQILTIFRNRVSSPLMFTLYFSIAGVDFSTAFNLF